MFLKNSRILENSVLTDFIVQSERKTNQFQRFGHRSDSNENSIRIHISCTPKRKKGFQWSCLLLVQLAQCVISQGAFSNAWHPATIESNKKMFHKKHAKQTNSSYTHSFFS